MSNKPNAAQRTEELAQKSAPTLAELHEQVTELRGFVRTMALLALPPQMRTPCACGRIADRNETYVVPKEVVAKHASLCDRCQIPVGATQVGTVYLDGNLRETARLANALLDTKG
jgi:hypothetical protein